MLTFEGVRSFATNWKIRIVTAVWCLACFILAQAYNVELISYTMSPNRQSIINSAKDILKLTVERRFPIDSALMNNRKVLHLYVWAISRFIDLIYYFFLENL